DYVLLLRRATDRASGAAFERSPPHVDQRGFLPAYRGQAGARAWLQPAHNYSAQGISTRSQTRAQQLRAASRNPVGRGGATILAADRRPHSGRFFSEGRALLQRSAAVV